MNVWPSRWASMLPRISHFFPNKGHKVWGKRDKFNNACLGDWARCYLLAAIRPAVDQWRLKQQVSISPDESLACQGGGRIFCQDEHLLHCLLNSLWLQQRRKHHKSSFKSSRDAAAVNRAPFEPLYEHGKANTMATSVRAVQLWSWYLRYHLCSSRNPDTFESSLKFMTIKRAADLRGSALHGVQTLEVLWPSRLTDWCWWGWRKM